MELRRQSGRQLAKLMAQGVGGSAQECGGGLGGAWRCQRRCADLGGLLQMLPEAKRVLEAVAVLRRHGAELLEVRRCSGSNSVEWS